MLLRLGGRSLNRLSHLGFSVSPLHRPTSLVNPRTLSLTQHHLKSAEAAVDPFKSDRIRLAGYEQSVEDALNLKPREDLQEDANFSPNSSIFALLSVAVKVGEMVKAEKYFNHLLKIHQFKDPHIFNAMIEGYLVAADPKKAFDVFKKMLAKDIRPNKLSLILIVRALAPAGEPFRDIVTTILDEMTNQKIPLTLILKHPDLTGKELLLLQRVIDDYCAATGISPTHGEVDQTVYQEIIPDTTTDTRVRSLEEIALPNSVETSGMHDLRTTLEIMVNPNLDLRTKQEELEISAVLVAQRRFQELVSGGMIPSTIKSGELSEIINDWRKVLTPKVEEEIELCKSAQITLDRQIYGPFLQLLPPADIVEISIMELLSSYNAPTGTTNANVAGGVKSTKLMVGIGHAIEQTVNLREVKKRKKLLNLSPGRYEHTLQSPKLFNMTLRKLAAKIEMNAEAEFGTWTPMWPTAVKAKIGSFLLEIMLKHAKVKYMSPTGPKEVDAIFHTYNFQSTKRIGVIKFSEHLSNLLQRSPNLNIQGKMLPMLVPPRPYLTFKHGGYLTQNRSVLRTKEDNLEQYSMLRKASENHQLDKVLAALDVLGQTPWRINGKVLDIQLKIWEAGGGRGEIAPLEDIPVPPKPANFDTLSAGERRKYIMEKNKIIKWNKEMHSLRCDVNYKLEIAKTFRGYTTYFPHNIDFRGRAYPIPPHLNHVGSDQCRGLLLFDVAKPLGERGLWWLKVHLGNLMGADKLSFSERIKYVEDRRPQIFAAADDPLQNDWWLNKDDCWQLLAACFELTEALRSPDPHKFMSRLPVHQDGSCNGLQHYAALGGDIEGATSVNLLDSDIPQDVYTRVAQTVIKLIEDDLANPYRKDHELAKLVHGKVDRKVVKQTVMTNVYGVTFVGARLQIEARLKDRGDTKEEHLYACSVYLAKKIFESLERMFTGAREIQFWLTNTAREISSSRPLTKEEISSEQTNYTAENPKRFEIHQKPKFDGLFDPENDDAAVSDEDLEAYLNARMDDPKETGRDVEQDFGDGLPYGDFDGDEEEEEEDAPVEEEDLVEEVFESKGKGKGKKQKSKTKAAEKPKKASGTVSRKLDMIKGVTNVSWTTPLGLPVVQPYRKNVNKQVYTTLQTVQIKDPSLLGASNVIRQKSAFPPNFIHSLDSTHMFMTALACQLSPEKVTFASVHDSFWTHAATVDKLNEFIREEFIKLHSQPIMQRLRDEFMEKYKHHVIYDPKHKSDSRPVQIPPIPKRGNFDIKAVKDSKYFFD